MKTNVWQKRRVKKLRMHIREMRWVIDYLERELELWKEGYRQVKRKTREEAINDEINALQFRNDDLHVTINKQEQTIEDLQRVKAEYLLLLSFIDIDKGEIKKLTTTENK